MADKPVKTLPKHIAFIVDGNRRWARERGLSTYLGHKKGMEQVEKIIEHTRARGIKIVTFYAFSTENWQRSQEEVAYLMKIFEDLTKRQLKKANEEGIKLRILGDPERLPQSLKRVLREAVETTRNNKALVVNIALNYGGRDEIVRAVRKIIKMKKGVEDITEELISQNLDTGGLPDPDFIVRTSGEQRLSNFLPWQGTYAELYFPKTYWPDFDARQLDIAISEFQKRQRRRGK